MSQANFAYSIPANDAAGLPLALSIYADRADLRATLREDAEATGFRIVEAAGVAALLEGDAHPLGEVVLLDCPHVDGAALAALVRLDMRAAHCGAQLIVSTSVEALDDVFACMDQSRPQILVDPSRADRVIALGAVLARFPQMRLRELREEDRLMLLRLTEQVGQIAERLEGLSATPARFGEGRFDFRGTALDCFDGDCSLGDRSHGDRSLGVRPEDADDRFAPEGQAAQPDPRLVRRIIRQRERRLRFFDSGLFADPAWDMLLDLTAARAEQARVSVSSLCIASGVPPTTALRWISQMTEAGLFRRVEDDCDRRRAFIALTEKAADAMTRYFAELDQGAVQLI